MISDQQHEAFAARGVLRLERLLPESAWRPARERVRALLESMGLMRDGRWQRSRSDTAVCRHAISGIKALQRSGIFDALVTPPVREAAGAVLGRAHCVTAMRNVQALFTPPDAVRWMVPSAMWHVDMPRLTQPGVSGVQMFSFVEPAPPGGGATLVVAGSHRFLNDGRRIASKDLKRALARHQQYFCDLLSKAFTDRDRFLRREQVGDVEVQVVELHGMPGDVYFVDMGVLHTVAPNASSGPRVMATQRFLDESAAQEVFQGAVKLMSMR